MSHRRPLDDPKPIGKWPKPSATAFVNGETLGRWPVLPQKRRRRGCILCERCYARLNKGKLCSACKEGKT